MIDGARIGIIAEDASDYETLKVLVNKLRPSAGFVFRKAVGNGCGRITSKANKFARVLKNKGCACLVVVQDADGKDPAKLRSQLKKTYGQCPIDQREFVIPVQEIEAWLLSDTRAIAQAFGINRGFKQVANPETIRDAKKHLRDWIKANLKKQYLNTVHNERIAEHIEINQIDRCASFAALRQFVCA